MPVPISPEIQDALRYSANKAMWWEWNRAHPAGAKIDEVSCVRNLIGYALPKVQEAWSHQLSAIGVTATLTGVVCHGHPFVRYNGASRACELGDFLLVHDHRPVPGVLERRAAIVQAKVFHQNGVRSQNPIQLALYRAWPRFAFWNRDEAIQGSIARGWGIVERAERSSAAGVRLALENRSVTHAALQAITL